MKILAIAKILPRTTPESLMLQLNPELKRAWELYTGDVFREMYYRRDGAGVVMVLECASVEEARSVIATLPMVSEGLIDFDFIPLGPFVGLSELFAPETTPGNPG
jgi:hypothetical protein